MKNQFLTAIVFTGLASIFGACQKNQDVLPVENTQKSSARINIAGVVYVPLNIILKANKNAYSGVWTKDVDLDADTVNDFTFSLSIIHSRGNDFYQLVSQISAIEPGGGVVSAYYPTVLSGAPSAWNSLALVSGTPIGPASITWNSPSWPATFLYSYYFGARRGGAIIGKGDKMIGMRFVSKGKTYYGWMTVNITSNGLTFTIKDAAFMNAEGVSINAGQRN